MESVKVYLSSSNEDSCYRQKLILNLAGLKREGKIKLLNDFEILPGVLWKEQILQRLEEAELVLFLVSSDFIASDFIFDVEIKRTLERKQDGKVNIVPIIIRPCDFESLSLSNFQTLPLNKIPVSVWKNNDEAWLEVIIQLKKVVQAIIDEKTTSITKQENKVIRRLFPFACTAAAASLILFFTFSINDNSIRNLPIQSYSSYNLNIHTIL